MIFVTVGTHEQPFDRLLKKVDELIADDIIKDEVFIQRGYSNYIPKKSNSEVLIPYELMQIYYKKAKIVITHGGPCSIIQSMMYGTIPIVVPRMLKHGEHVDNHQVFFAQFLEKKNKILSVYDISELSEVISNYEKKISCLLKGDNVPNILEANIKNFSKKLDTVCSTLP